MADNVERRRRPRNFRDRVDYLNILPEKQIKEKYRLTRNQIEHLHDLIGAELEPLTRRSNLLSPMTKFTNVVAQWPGSTHDNTIFEQCGVKTWLEAEGVGWLIGDSGYALRPYMFTPKNRPTTQAELEFNMAQSRTRMVVERAFGLLKTRFRCLHKTGGFLQVSPPKTALIFTVCAKLHNICLGDEPADPQNYNDDGADDDNTDANALEVNDANAIRMRAELINRFQ